MVHRILHQTGCLPSRRCTVGVGQARPPEPGEAFTVFLFSQLHTLPAVPISTENPAPPIPSWLLPQPVPAPSLSQPAGVGGVKGLPQANASRVSGQLGVYALQALTEQDLASGYDAPNARLSRELETRARNVRTLAYDIQRTFQSTQQPTTSQRPARGKCVLGAGQ